MEGDPLQPTSRVFDPTLKTQFSMVVVCRRLEYPNEKDIDVLEESCEVTINWGVVHYAR